MWNRAADSGELAAVLIPAVWTFLGVLVMTLGTLGVQALKSKSERATSTQPSSAQADGVVLIQLAKEQGSLVQRADDNDERDDVQDRALGNHGDRIEALERYNDHRDPNWRRR